MKSIFDKSELVMKLTTRSPKMDKIQITTNKYDANAPCVFYPWGSMHFQMPFSRIHPLLRKYVQRLCSFGVAASGGSIMVP
jgi:lysophospholipid acyltransferase (LPLAT)-like uncharacterized protein